MASVTVTIDATVPTNATLDVLVEEDTDGNGTVDNSNTISVVDGTNTYSPSGFDASAGNYYRVRPLLTTTSVTDSPATLNSSSVEPIQAPSAPASASLVVDGNDSIDLTVDPPSDWGGEVGSYEVEMLRDGGSWASPSGGPSNPSGSTSTQTYNYGPAADTAYGRQVGIDSSFRFRVRATNSEGTSSWSYTSTEYTDPVAPHNPSVSRPDGNTFEISWENVTDSANIVKLHVREDTGNGYGSWANFKNTSPSNEIMTVSVGDSANWDDLTIQEDARYQFRIVYENSNSNFVSLGEFVFCDYGNEGNVYFEDDFEGDLSAWNTTNMSDADSGIVSGSTPDAGVSGPDSGSNYLRLDGGDYIYHELGDLSNESDVILKLTMAAGLMDGPDEVAQIQFYDGSSWNPLRDLAWEYNEQGWVEVTALVPDSYLSTTNSVQLRCDASSGSGGHAAFDRLVVSDILHEYTTPVAPSNLSLDASVVREVTMSWDINATFVDGNNEAYKQSSESSWTSASAGGLETTRTITGLLDGEDYDFRTKSWILQFRRGSSSQYFNSSYATGTTTTILPVPSSFGVLLSPDRTGLLPDWVDESNNEAGFHVYRATVASPTFPGDYTEVGTPGANSTSYKDTNVTEDTTYTYRVTAYTTHVESSPTPEVSERFPYTYTRQSRVSADGAVSTDQRSVSKPRSSDVSTDASIDNTRSLTFLRESALETDAHLSTESRSITFFRDSVLSADAGFFNETIFTAVFPSELTYGDISWEFNNEIGGFVSEWVYHEPAGGHGTVALYMQGTLIRNPVYTYIQYSETKPPTDYDVEDAYTSETRTIHDTDEAVVFDATGAERGYYRIVIENLEPRDVLSKVIFGTTHT